MVVYQNSLIMVSQLEFIFVEAYIDGCLVGGVSLDAASFAKIVRSQDQ